MRFELMTSSLPRRRSTPELRGRYRAQAVSLRAYQISPKSQTDKTNSLSYLILERATRFELATLSLEG